MAKIRFSHRYVKMPDDMQFATLLEVFITDRKELSKSFIEYDTSFWARDYSSSDTFAKKENYPLPKGKVLILLLYNPNPFGNPILFTTVRRATPEKEAYYRSLRGQEVEIVIEEKEKSP